jgi:hypothetical protein
VLGLIAQYSPIFLLRFYMASTNVYIKSGDVHDMQAPTASTFTGAWMYKASPNTTIQVVATAAATVVIEVSNDGVNAIATALGTVTLAGAGSDGFVTNAPWKYIRARATANAGLVNVIMGS